MPIEILIPLNNVPGTVAKVAETLGKAGVNLQGIGYPTGARGVLRVIANESTKALAALKAAKLNVRQTKEVLVLSIPDEPGALGAVARKLAKARVNIEAFYVVGSDSGRLRVVFAVDKLDKAKTIVGL